jgi:hypothetical protein
MPNNSAAECPVPPSADPTATTSQNHPETNEAPTEVSSVDAVAGPSGLWNAMVNPLRFMPIEGVLWMQGEANSGSESGSLRYACELPKMISLWRNLWTPRLPGQPDATVFGVVQLAPFETAVSVAQLRWSQLAAMALPNVTVASAIDLFDAGSPCGNVHFRDKQPAAERIAATWRSILDHNTSLPPADPVATTATPATADGTVVVSIEPNSQRGIEFVSKPNQTTASGWENFELLVQSSASAEWRCGKADVLNPGTSGEVAAVQVQPSSPLGSGEQVVGVRYAWAPVPNGTFIMGAEFDGVASNGASRTFRRVASPFVLLPSTSSASAWVPMNFSLPIPGGNAPAGCE